MSRPITGMSSTGGASQPDWSTLPSELLRFISERVSEIGDYVRFGAVCKVWHSAASPAANLLPQDPWLLLPYDTDSTIRRFFSLSNRRRYMLDLPNFRGRVICNSAGGWMLMVDSSFSFSLFNPLTKDLIHLPPLSTALSDLYDNLLVARDLMAFETYGRLDPNTQLLTMHHCFHSHLSMTANCEGIITLILGDRFVYCKIVQSTSWVNPRGIYRRSPETVTYHRGRLYIVHSGGQVAECELNPESKPRLIPSLSVPTVNYACCYLVEVNGVLLLVICKYPNDFEYLKLEAVGQPKWSKINDIGHYSLLVRDGVISATAEGASGCTRNNIYQCILDHTSQMLFMRSIADDTRIFLFAEDVEKHYSHGTWFFPTLS